MKLSAIKRQCMAVRQIVIFEDGEKQWLGTRSACWPVESVELTKESVIELFDLTPKKVEEFDIDVVRIRETSLFGDPHTAREATQVMKVCAYGKRLWLVDCDGVMLLIDAEKIKTACSDDEYRGITIRQGSAGSVAVVSDGLIPCGYILPESRSDEREIMQKCRRIAQMHTRSETEPTI